MPTPSIAHARPAALLGLALIAAALTGCQSAPKASYPEVLAAYEAGNYAAAYDGAADLAAKSEGSQQVRAHYLAGLSAYQLNRDDAAVRHLWTPRQHSDNNIAGPAAATTGLSYARMGKHENAVIAFKQAVDKLTGNDQAQAYYHLGVSEQKIGRWAEARTHLSLAGSRATDPGLRESARQKLDATGFTLQFGAYGNRENANERAQAVYDACQRANVGPPRVASSTAGGKTLFLVQAGRFGTYASALRSRQQLTDRNVLITSLGQ